MESSLSFALTPASRAAVRAGGWSREAVWGCVTSHALHVAAAAGLYVLVGTDLLSYSPPSGAASIELSAAFSHPATPAAEVRMEAAPAASLAPAALARQAAQSEHSGEEMPEVAAAPSGELPPLVRMRSPDDPGPAPAAGDAAAAPTPRSAAPAPAFALTGPAAAQAASHASAGSQADSLPVAAFQPAPVYPPELERAGIEGTVTFRLKIAADGSVSEALVEKTSGYAAMDRAALEAVRRWRFTPARRFGLPVAIEVRKRFPFVIERQP
jgi:protein TonB